MSFKTKFNSQPFAGRENSRKVKPEFAVQKYGFITIEQQINRLLSSGANLERYRLEQAYNRGYDYPDGVFTDDDAEVEHIRDANYDLVDFSADLEYLQSKAQTVKPVKHESLQNGASEAEKASVE